MSSENSRKYSPPYISPRSFYHLIERLQENIPGRIDRSYLDTMFSGSSSTQVMAAMRFLTLIDAGNKPTHPLRLLVDSRGEERVKRLKDVCNSAFAPVFNSGSVDLRTATFAQFEELFHDQFGVDGDVRRKCIKFFTTLASDAGIELSPHITKKVRTTSSTATRAPVKKASSRSSRIDEIPQAGKVPEHTELLDKLLGKFPDFDFSWTQEQKAAWLESFNIFMQKIYPELRNK